jgi:hypothetical protein
MSKTLVVTIFILGMLFTTAYLIKKNNSEKDENWNGKYGSWNDTRAHEKSDRYRKEAEENWIERYFSF